MELQMGIIDDTERQDQPRLRINPLLGNIAVFGGPMSGKSTFVKTMLVRLHQNYNQRQERIYLVDFGGSLGDFKNLECVCAAFDNSNEENIKRVFRTVENQLKENADILNGRNFHSVWQADPKNCPPHMTLIIENINAFLEDERYATYQELLTMLCRDGLSKGLTVVVTGRDTSGMGKLLTNFAYKIGFGLSAEEYAQVFGAKIIPPMKLPGRGIVNLGGKTYEFQCFLPFHIKEKEGLAPFLKHAEANPNRLEAFPKELTKQFFERKYPDYRPSKSTVVLGMDYYDHSPLELNYEESRSIGIYGKRRFGKTNLLRLILDHIEKNHPGHYRYVFLDDGREQLWQILSGNCPDDETSRRRNMEDAVKHAGRYEAGDKLYFRKPEKFREYLVEKGYVRAAWTDTGPLMPGERYGRDSARQTPPPQPSPTVFVIDSKLFYQGLGEDQLLLETYIPQIANTAKDHDYILILADVRAVNIEVYEILNRCMTDAFLLDDLGDFIADRGHKSVFGELDQKEMKSTYARCELGDGFSYSIEADRLKKVKFFKAPDV